MSSHRVTGHVSSSETLEAEKGHNADGATDEDEQEEEDVEEDPQSLHEAVERLTRTDAINRHHLGDVPTPADRWHTVGEG